MPADLKELYGENAITEMNDILTEIRQGSNITITPDHVKLGCQFTMIHARRILDGEEKKVSLKSLMNKSFGEAAIAIYQ